MLRKKATAPPKLRAKAAEARGLISFAAELAIDLLSTADPVDLALKEAVLQLKQCYECLSRAAPIGDRLKLAARKFAANYIAVSLAVNVKGLFVYKPKFHMFEELTEMEPGSSRPNSFWTYRDEDFGGSIAKWARRRGGSAHPGVVSLQILNMFKAMHEMPSVV